MMVLSRSIETWPSVSERVSRIVASVTKPSITSTLPSGALKRFCSVSAMLRWSWLTMPFVRRVWPNGICAIGGACTVPMSAPRFEVREPPRDAGRIEGRGLVARGFERAAVKARGDARLAHVVEAHGEVVEDVRVARLESMRLEVRDLRLAPARVRGVEIAEHEIERGAFGMQGEVAQQLRLEGVGPRKGHERPKSRERPGVS